MTTIEERNTKYKLDSTMIGIVSNLRASAVNTMVKKAEILELKSSAAYDMVFSAEEKAEIDGLLTLIQSAVSSINALPSLKR